VFYGSGSPNFAANVGAWLSEHGLRLAISCFGAAITEEILFRRYAQFHLQRFLPINWALLLNAVLFMLLHGRLSLEIFCAGIAFGILASHFQCIYAVMLIHGLSNFIGMAGASMPRSDEVMPASLVLMGSWVSAFFAAFALLLLALVFTLVRARRSEL
jgi:membrane protease YdiL (CAAX protease family)